MKCPTDGSELVMSDRQGIEIDYCPKCRGVWLDRGELDKIIQRASAAMTADPLPDRGAGPARPDYRVRPERRHRDDDEDERYRRPPKRRSMLDDLFDF